VAGYGGRTAIVGDLKNHATRAILARVARVEDHGAATDQRKDQGRTEDQGRTKDQGPRTKDQVPR